MSLPHAGEVLAGKYRVERVLGQGAMGVVVAAKHLQLGQNVAIKLLHHAATPEMAKRFLREARAAARLRSEHVTRVLDVGELSDGAPYMVMEYLDGNDLKEVLKQRQMLPIEEAVEHVLQASEAIAEAHAAGIIHRDLKPANLFLTKTADGSSTVKVLDFGISKTIDGDESADGLQLTKSTAVLGSPLYMSPEQINSAHGVSPQSDIWSLGAILYQLLAGQVPFNASSFSDLVIQINSRSPPPLSSYRQDVPFALESAIVRCLQKDLATRFPNVAELAWAIAPYGPQGADAYAKGMTRMLEAVGVTIKRPPDASLGSLPPPLFPPPAEPMAITGARTALTSSTGSTGAHPPRVKPRLIVGAAIAVVAVGVGAAFALRNVDRSSEQAAVPSAVVEAPPSLPSSIELAPSAPVPSVIASAALPPASATASAALSEPTATGAARPSAARPPGTTRPVTTARPTATATAAPQTPKNPLDIKLKD